MGRSPGAKSLPGPALGYHKSLALYVLTDTGEVCSVSRCPSPAFRVLVLVAAMTSRNPEATAKALADLDYSQPLSKFYALNLLQESGASIPTFASEEEATSSQVKEKA